MNSAHRSSRRTWLSRRRFLTAAGFAALAACRGGFEQPRQDTVPQPASGTITWLQRAQPVEVEWAERIVLPRLRELAPNVTINLTLESGNWADKVFTLYAAGTPPDVHNGIVGTFIQLYAQEEVLELTPLIKRDKIDLSPFGGFQNDPDMCRRAASNGSCRC
jgi:ABC-type glycerol-3-phosphate transport system substrate-binding protein